MISDLPKRFYGGVEQKNDTPHTSLSVWALLDEGALFHVLAKKWFMRKNTHREELRSSEQWKQGNTRSRSPREPAFGRFFCAYSIVLRMTLKRIAW